MDHSLQTAELNYGEHLQSETQVNIHTVSGAMSSKSLMYRLESFLFVLGGSSTCEGHNSVLLSILSASKALNITSSSSFHPTFSSNLLISCCFCKYQARNVSSASKIPDFIHDYGFNVNLALLMTARNQISKSEARGCRKLNQMRLFLFHCLLVLILIKFIVMLTPPRRLLWASAASLVLFATH